MRHLLAVFRTYEVTLFGIVLLAVVVIESVTPRFLTTANLNALMVSGVVLAVVAVGEAFVIIQGGVDISVGAVLGVASIIVAKALLAGWPPIAAMACGMAAGMALGSLNGIIVVRGRVPAIVATLGTMSVWSAVIFYLLNGEWIDGIPDRYSWLSVQIGPVPWVGALGLILGCYALAAATLSWSRFGRQVYGVGDSTETARLTGIRVNRVSFWAYALAGLFVGLAAVIYVTVDANIEVDVGTSIPLAAIAACVLGGVDITGGAGNPIGVLLGVTALTVMENGSVLVGVPSLYEQAVVGGLIIISVLVWSVRRGRRPAAWVGG